uniref:Uncharacterized protein n=1 Tax=Candidatus Kentrum sp. SD TaxID=2126332 RepID=A0A451BMY7_9GAMM|nr:MAG: hypothetical protein BECKSD772D_GA0070982_105817 [Candidatus Kentron sp. SD]
MPYQNIDATLSPEDIKTIKAAAKTTPGLKPVAEQLGERFKQAKKKKKPDAPEE